MLGHLVSTGEISEAKFKEMRDKTNCNRLPERAKKKRTTR